MIRKQTMSTYRLAEYIEALIAAFLLVAALLLAGCSKGNPNGATLQYSSIRGTVTDDAGSYSTMRLGKTDAAVQGASVVATRVLADGTLSPISDTARTDANGHFTLTCDATNITNVVVVATKAGARWEAVVSDKLSQGGTETCPPMNRQTTVQAQVYSRMVTDVGADGVVYDDVALYVSSSLASAMGTDMNAVADVAAAIEAGESTWLQAMANSSIGNATQQGNESIYYARMNAQAGFQTALYNAAGNQAEAGSAFHNYEQAELGSYASAGLNLDAAARVHEVVARAMINASSRMDGDVRLEFLRQVALMRALFIMSGVNSMMQAMGSSQVDMTSADSAYSTLEASIIGSTSTDLINAAFVYYHNSIVTMLGGMNGMNSTTIADLDAGINADGAAKATLFSAIAAQLSAQALTQAYATYFNTVSSSVNASVNGLSGPKVQALAAILMLTNMTA